MANVRAHLPVLKPYGANLVSQHPVNCSIIEFEEKTLATFNNALVQRQSNDFKQLAYNQQQLNILIFSLLKAKMREQLRQREFNKVDKHDVLYADTLTIENLSLNAETLTIGYTINKQLFTKIVPIEKLKKWMKYSADRAQQIEPNSKTLVLSLHEDDYIEELARYKKQHRLPRIWDTKTPENLIHSHKVDEKYKGAQRLKKLFELTTDRSKRIQILDNAIEGKNGQPKLYKRYYLFGFIPWGRVSTLYTWAVNTKKKLIAEQKREASNLKILAKPAHNMLNIQEKTPPPSPTRVPSPKRQKSLSPRKKLPRQKSQEELNFEQTKKNLFTQLVEVENFIHKAAALMNEDKDNLNEVFRTITIFNQQNIDESSSDELKSWIKQFDIPYMALLEYKKKISNILDTLKAYQLSIEKSKENLKQQKTPIDNENINQQYEAFLQPYLDIEKKLKQQIKDAEKENEKFNNKMQDKIKLYHFRNALIAANTAENTLLDYMAQAKNKQAHVVCQTLIQTQCLSPNLAKVHAQIEASMRIAENEAPENLSVRKIELDYWVGLLHFFRENPTDFIKIDSMASQYITYHLLDKLFKKYEPVIGDINTQQLGKQLLNFSHPAIVDMLILIGKLHNYIHDAKVATTYLEIQKQTLTDLYQAIKHCLDSLKEYDFETESRPMITKLSSLLENSLLTLTTTTQVKKIQFEKTKNQIEKTLFEAPQGECSLWVKNLQHIETVKQCAPSEHIEYLKKRVCWHKSVSSAQEQNFDDVINLRFSQFMKSSHAITFESVVKEYPANQDGDKTSIYASVRLKSDSQTIIKKFGDSSLIPNQDTTRINTLRLLSLTKLNLKDNISYKTSHPHLFKLCYKSNPLLQEICSYWNSIQRAEKNNDIKMYTALVQCRVKQLYKNAKKHLDAKDANSAYTPMLWLCCLAPKTDLLKRKPLANLIQQYNKLVNNNSKRCLDPVKFNLQIANVKSQQFELAGHRCSQEMMATEPPAYQDGSRGQAAGRRF